MPFCGFNLPDAGVSQGVRDSFSLQSMLNSMPSAYECIKAFPETSFFLLIIKEGQPRN
jgi:non-heme chloroperoxidase